MFLHKSEFPVKMFVGFQTVVITSHCQFYKLPHYESNFHNLLLNFPICKRRNNVSLRKNAIFNDTDVHLQLVFIIIFFCNSLLLPFHTVCVRVSMSLSIRTPLPQSQWLISRSYGRRHENAARAPGLPTPAVRQSFRHEHSVPFGIIRI